MCHNLDLIPLCRAMRAVMIPAEIACQLAPLGGNLQPHEVARMLQRIDSGEVDAGTTKDAFRQLVEAVKDQN